MLAIVGPTAAGKSALAIDVASRVNAEIVSIDSTAIYRGMDIGTDKPSREDLAKVRHHMIDVVEPGQTVTVAEFREMARAAIEDISGRGLTPLLVGGSGLYFRAVVDPLEFPGTDPGIRQRFTLESEGAGAEQLYERLREIDPEAAERIQPANTRRVIRALEVIELTGRPFSSFRDAWDDYRSIYDLAVAGITYPREILDTRINDRVNEQIGRGLLHEIRSLVEQGFRNSLTSVQALGYSQLLAHLDGQMSFEEAIDEIKRRTRKFARRQMSWFKADPRVRWFEADPQGAAEFLERDRIET